jgi:hypothetical protein
MTTGLTDLKRLERETFRRFYDDGLLDIYLGSMLIVMGLAAVIADRLNDEFRSMLVMLAIATAVTVPLLVVRRSLLRSRLGAFRPNPERRGRIKSTRLALLASVVVGVMMFGVAAATLGGGAAEDTVTVLLPLVWFVNGVVVIGAAAFFLNVPRFYFHGVAWGLAMPLLIWPDLLWDYQLQPWLALGLPGAAIVVVGVYKLMRFLRDYPAPPAGETTDA